VEDVLTLTLEALRDAKARMRPVFGQERVALSTGRFLETLLGNEPRKTGWMRAEAAGDPGPWRQQALLGRGHWDADALRDVVRDHVVEHLGDRNGNPDRDVGASTTALSSPQAERRSIALTAWSALKTVRSRYRTLVQFWSNRRYDPH
ncbi:hypothetical protein EDC31_1761, partial [Acidomonas methanolica]